MRKRDALRIGSEGLRGRRNGPATTGAHVSASSSYRRVQPASVLGDQIDASRRETVTCTPGTECAECAEREVSGHASIGTVAPFGDDPVGVTQTCVSQTGPAQTAEPSADPVETRTQVVGPAAPAVGNSCSPSSYKFTSIPSGKLTPTYSGGSFGASFDMKAEFETPIPCTCVSGEYRQFVRGWFKANGAKVTHRLCGSDLDAASYQEDCTRIGGTDYKYGYHSIPFATSKFTNPDQATGCNFIGYDRPAITGTTGDVLEMNLEFIGKLVDASDRDRELKSSSWSVVGSVTVP